MVIGLLKLLILEDREKDFKQGYLATIKYLYRPSLAKKESFILRS